MIHIDALDRLKAYDNIIPISNYAMQNDNYDNYDYTGYSDYESHFGTHGSNASEAEHEQLDEIIEKGLHIDAKSQLQEMCQEKEDFTPYYKVEDEKGPDHDKKFTMGVYIKDELIATGIGSSKQKAEDVAAENALKTKGWDEK